MSGAVFPFSVALLLTTDDFHVAWLSAAFRSFHIIISLAISLLLKIFDITILPITRHNPIFSRYIPTYRTLSFFLKNVRIHQTNGDAIQQWGCHKAFPHHPNFCRHSREIFNISKYSPLPATFVSTSIYFYFKAAVKGVLSTTRKCTKYQTHWPCVAPSYVSLSG